MMDDDELFERPKVPYVFTPVDEPMPQVLVIDPRRQLHGIDLEDPRIVALGKEMIRVGKAQAASERDAYRALLEARVAGLEALLNAIVKQVPYEYSLLGDGFMNNIKRANSYLAGSGTL